MRMLSDSKIAIVSLVALLIWVFVALPLIYFPTPTTFLDRVLHYAPLLTPTVGSIAAVIAIAAISAQKSIARKRAAVDFFLKTDLDHNMLDAYTAFETARKKFNAHAASGGSVKDFLENSETEKDYKSIVRYLNIHELVAVGIKNKVLDERVCYNFWSDAMVRHVRELRSIIEYEIEDGGSAALFLELRHLSAKWSIQIADWNRKVGKAQRG